MKTRSYHGETLSCQKQSGVSAYKKYYHAQALGIKRYTADICSVAKETSTANKMASKEIAVQEYLKKHRIMELFENLTAQLIYERPGEYFNKHPIDIYDAEICF